MTGIESSMRWTIHGERVVDESRRLRLSIADVELPDGVRFEQYVLRLPKAAVMVVLDDPGTETSRVRAIRVQRLRGPSPTTLLMFLTTLFHVPTFVARSIVGRAHRR